MLGQDCFKTWKNFHSSFFFSIALFKVNLEDKATRAE